MSLSTKGFLKRFRGEIIITSISLALSVMASILVAVFFSARDLYLLGFYMFGFLIVCLMLSLLFNQKRLYDKRTAVVDQILIDNFGYASRDNQYFRRREHYAREKRKLCEVLVNSVLPDLMKRIFSDHPNLKKLNIIIDSGTTLTPLFTEMSLCGIDAKNRVEVDIYTNNMAGIEELHKLESSEGLPIPSINLIGGRPLSRYRATTGEATEAFLKTLWDKQENSKGGTMTLSILTANWFLAGRGLDRISLCARGLGHLEFKANVCDHSDYRILISPLGKLLHLNDVRQLNELLSGYEDDQYSSYLIPDGQKGSTILLTTRRDIRSLSPLRHLWISLEQIAKDDSAWNYTFCSELPFFEPPGNSFDEVFINETPHKYIRDNFERAYGFSPRG